MPALLWFAPTLALRFPLVINFSLPPIFTCLSISCQHLSRPSLSALQLGWYTDTSLILIKHHRYHSLLYPPLLSFLHQRVQRSPSQHHPLPFRAYYCNLILISQPNYAPLLRLHLRHEDHLQNPFLSITHTTLLSLFLLCSLKVTLCTFLVTTLQPIPPLNTLAYHNDTLTLNTIIVNMYLTVDFLSLFCFF